MRKTGRGSILHSRHSSGSPKRLLVGGPGPSRLLFPGRNHRRPDGKHPRGNRWCSRCHARRWHQAGAHDSNPRIGSLKPITGQELCRLLEAHGWQLRRINGSHHIFSKSGERKLISVPVHGNRDLKPGLATKIARDAGISW